MKVNRIVIGLVLFLSQVLAVEASAQNQKVEYSYTSFPSMYAVRQEDGTVGPPRMEVVFNKENQAQHALTAKIGEKQVSCPLLYQDVAYLLDKQDSLFSPRGSGKRGPDSWSLLESEKKDTILILAYSGCPFQIKNLSVEKNIIFREKTKLLIESTQGSVLQLAKDSGLPFVASPSGLMFVCTSVVNVVWSFPRPGMIFETEDAIYTTIKSQASIAFTKDGIKMDGVKKKDKKVTNR